MRWLFIYKSIIKGADFIILETERLILRNFKDKDLEKLYEYRNDIRCYKYQRYDDTSKEYLKKVIKINKDKKLIGESVNLAIALKSSDKIIGDIYIGFKDKTITLGYTISYENQRRGFAYEIIMSLITYIFEEFEDYEIVCLVDPKNEASIRLLEKLKFKEDGYLEELNSLIYFIENK